MQPIDQAVRVSFRYPVHFTTDLFSPNNPLLRDVLAGDGVPSGSTKVLCIIDSGVAQHHRALPGAIVSYFESPDGPLTLVVPPVIVNGGESVKNDPAQVMSIHRAIHEYGIDRHSYVVAIGGGALLDMVGYAAATAHRGVRLVRVPTTVLAQNDSGSGSRTASTPSARRTSWARLRPRSRCSTTSRS